MSDSKRYYYLKLKENFFDSDEMILLESMTDGYLYGNILLKLYLRSLKTEGKLMVNDHIPFNPQMLAHVTRHQVGTVEKALDVFRQLGLVEVLDSGVIYMLDIQNFIGESSTEADRIRNYRNRINKEKNQNQIESEKTNPVQMYVQMYDKCTPEYRDKSIELDLELELEKEKEKETDVVVVNAGAREVVDNSKSEKTKSSNFKKVVDVYHKNIGMVHSAFEKEKLEDLSERFSVEWINKAIEIAVLNQARKLSYIESILNNWQTNGIDSKPKKDGYGGKQQFSNTDYPKSAVEVYLERKKAKENVSKGDDERGSYINADYSIP